MERIWESDPAARLMVVGAHEDPYVMPLHGVEDFYHWDRMFWLAHEAWRCPACDHRGFDPMSPWVSPHYRRYQELTGQPEEPT